MLVTAHETAGQPGALLWAGLIQACARCGAGKLLRQMVSSRAPAPSSLIIVISQGVLNVQLTKEATKKKK